jgi:hypothetical protein
MCKTINLSVPTKFKTEFIEVLLKYTETTFATLQKFVVVGETTFISVVGCAEHDIKNIKNIEEGEKEYFALLK